MGLKPVTTKEEFVKTPGPKVLTSPRGPRARKLSEEAATSFKALLFGASGSGKTYAIKGLLEHGYRVLCISTDMGGSGLQSIVTALRNENKVDLLDNCISLVLNNYEEVTAFLNAPESMYPEIYDENITWLYWDGLSSFQQNHLSDFIGAMQPEGDKTVSDARESGLQFQIQDWGMMKNGTIRNLDRFLKLHNRKTGEPWYKIVSCLEGIKAVKSGSGVNVVTSYQEINEPLLQGSAAKLITPAFDLILQTKVVVNRSEDEPRSYKYICAPAGSVTGPKSRGITLDPIEPGDFYSLWTKISTQLGINKNIPTEGVAPETTAAIS